MVREMTMGRGFAQADDRALGWGDICNLAVADWWGGGKLSADAPSSP